MKKDAILKVYAWDKSRGINLPGPDCTVSTPGKLKVICLQLQPRKPGGGGGGGGSGRGV